MWSFPASHQGNHGDAYHLSVVHKSMRHADGHDIVDIKAGVRVDDQGDSTLCIKRLSKKYQDEKLKLSFVLNPSPDLKYKYEM